MEDEQLSRIQNMEKEIYEVIRSLSNFDGVYYEKFLQKYIPFEKGKDIIRVIISDGNVVVHVLDMNDVTEVHYFRNLPKSIQIKIYDDVLK